MIRFIKLYIASYSGLSRQMWMLAIVTFINRAGSMVLPFMALYLINALDYSLKEAGLVMTCYGVGSLIGNYVGGRLTDSYGAYIVMVWSLFLGGLMYMSLIFASTISMMCLLFGLTSIVNDALRPASMASIALYSKSENRTRSVGLIRLAINLGFAAGPAFGGLLIGLTGYKWIFVIDGLTCLLAGIFMIYALENKGAGNHIKNSKVSSTKKTVYEDKLFWAFMIIVVCTGIIFMQLINIIPIYLEDIAKLTTYEIGLLMSLNGLLIAISEMPILHVLRNYNRPIKLMAFGAFIMGLSFLILVFSIHWIVIIIFFLLITYGEIFNFPYATSWAIDRSEDKTRGSYMGIYGMGFSLSAILGPSIGTVYVDHYGWSSWWLVCGMILTVVTIALLLIEKYLIVLDNTPKGFVKT